MTQLHLALVPELFLDIDGATLEIGAAHRPYAAVVVLAGDVPVDCDMNGIDDRVEIRNGTAADLNNNGVPDVCEGPLPPLQARGVPLGSGAAYESNWSEGLGYELLKLLESGDLCAAIEAEEDLVIAWRDPRSESESVLAIVGQTTGSLFLAGQATTYHWLTGQPRSRRVFAALHLR